MVPIGNHPVPREMMQQAFAALGFDLAMTFAALLLTQFGLSAIGELAPEASLVTIPFMAMVLAFWMASFLFWSPYADERTSGAGTLLMRVTFAVLNAWILLVAIVTVLGMALPVDFLLVFLGLNVAGVIGWRMVGVLVPQSRRTLLVGSHPMGVEFAEQAGRDRRRRFAICGVLADELARETELADDRYPVIGTLSSDLEAVIMQNQIEAVVMVLPSANEPAFEDLYAKLCLLPVAVYLIPVSLEDKRFSPSAELIERFQLSSGIPNRMRLRDRMLKRLIDIVLSSAALLLVLPVFSLVAIAIKLDSPGPVFFRQLRVGEYRRRFYMFKFRSMVVNAEKIQQQVNVTDEAGHVIHKTKNDPRITQVGKIIRKTSIDELPQLINVLLGDMSLVGPRPEMPWVVKDYEEWQYQRFVVPPGITGWWQINGRSDEKPMHLCTKDDLYYIQNYSLLLDLKIMFRTIPVVLSGKGSF
ncbi:MAG: sugar transferase [Chloroflexi bacterium]|nr:sugar transferase [Chloroflexota bacterium]